MVVGEGKDRQPVPRAKLFCLRFCGRIGFVARFTLTLDKHVFSVLDWRTMGGEVQRAGRAIIPHRPEDQEKSYYIRITPKAAAAGLQDGISNDDDAFERKVFFG